MHSIEKKLALGSQLHFNCSTLMGGQLEDISVGARPWYGSHWDERLYHRKFPLSSFNSTRLALYSTVVLGYILISYEFGFPFSNTSNPG